MTNLENSIYFDGFAPLIRIKSVKAWKGPRKISYTFPENDTICQFGKLLVCRPDALILGFLFVS